AMSGCVPIIGAFTLGDLYTSTSLVATGLTGKSLTDDALGVVTGKDCSVMGAVLEKDRKLCEENGAKVTQADFKGLLGAREKPVQAQAAADASTADDTQTDTQTAADTPTDTQAGASPTTTTAETQTGPSQPQAQATAVAFTRASASNTN
ncbi:MAG TPA: hypothetical protein VET84_03110, partial [Stellaceae bacterium]|nr:hypothetical protein [Stellaceae bacterium]